MAGNPYFGDILQIYLETGENISKIWRKMRQEFHLQREVARLTALIDDIKIAFDELPPCPAHGQGCIPHAVRTLRELVQLKGDSAVEPPPLKVRSVEYIMGYEFGGDTDYLVLTLSNGQRIAVPNDRDAHITTTLSDHGFDASLEEAGIAGRAPMGRAGADFIEGIRLID